MSILKKIKEKCMDCCSEQIAEVKECPVVKCALHPYRLGKNPFRQKRTMTDEQKKQAGERMKKARDAKKTG